MNNLSRLILGGLCAFVLAACATPTPAPTRTPQAPTVAPTLRPLLATPTPRPTLLPPVQLNPPDVEKRVTLRLVNGVAATFDVQLEGSLIATALGFALPTEPVYVAAGEYRLRVVPAGAALDVGTVLLDMRVTLPASRSVLLALSGTPEKPTATVFTNDVSAVERNKARLTIAHLLTTGDPLRAASAGKDLLTVQGAGKAESIADLNAGAQTLDFALGTAKATLSLQTAEQQAIFVILLGEAAAPNAVYFTDPTIRNSRARFLYAMRGTNTPPKVDLYLEDKRVATGLEYGGTTDWTDFTSAQYTLRVFKSGDAPDGKAQPIYSTRLDVQPDAANDVIIYGDPSLPQLLIAGEDLSRTLPEYARLTVVNLANSSERVQMYRGGVVQANLFPLTIGEASKPVAILPGPADFSFSTATTRTIVENKGTFSIKVGTVYLYVVDGGDANAAPLVFATDVGTGPLPTPTLTGSQAANRGLQVRLVNALADSTQVTVKIGENVLFNAIENGQMTAPLLVPTQPGFFTLYDAKSGKQIAQVNIAPVVNQTILLIASGKAASAKLVQQVELERPTTTSGMAQLIHAAAGAEGMRAEFSLTSEGSSGSSIDRPTVTPTIAVQEFARSVDYGTVAPPRLLPAGTYRIAVYTLAKNVRVAEATFTVEAGKHTDLVLIPAANNGFKLLTFISGELP